jgi:hypothetical protein|tara:strand:- start:2687 stop:3040 length:354 start_codon:yes stop_codon:yes gene_type:complete
MASKLTAEQKWKRYNSRTSKNMAAHNRSGGSVRSPVRSLSGASPKDKYDRAKFISRKATQVLSSRQPLKDKDGDPTPAAMQFRRWAASTPKNYDDVRKLKTRAIKQKESLAKKLGKK